MTPFKAGGDPWKPVALQAVLLGNGPLAGLAPKGELISSQVELGSLNTIFFHVRASAGAKGCARLAGDKLQWGAAACTVRCCDTLGPAWPFAWL